MIKILVIEDEQLVRNNILELLEAEGFDAIEANNGPVGVQLAKAELPDLIICDVMMPELDGYGVLKSLRQNLKTATIPFIFLTAKATKTDFRKGMQLGAHDYLTKPFTIDELLGAIHTQLEKQAVVQERYSSELKQKEEELNYLIYHDSITGLPNRLSLREQFGEILRSKPQHKENKPLIPVICLYLERFERINETLGHDYGDLLLKTVAQRLQEYFPKDNETVAYLNANKFAIILGETTTKAEAENITSKILELISEPIILKKQELYVTASIGLALYPYSGQEIETLLQHAQAAMDYSLSQGGDQYQFYTATLNSRSSELLALETGLRHALDRNELQVHYQPRVSLQTGKITGAEALVRWYSPQMGLISPQKFIPIAEETGLIIPIAEWVLSTACCQFQLWNSSRVDNPLYVAVNLSGRQFVQSDLHERLFKILLEAKMNPQYLELELTESMLVKNPPVARTKLSALKQLGIKIAIDDFGTGYSSLSYLQQFSFDILKIDRCFVRDIKNNPKNAVITEAILQIAQNLDFKVIAEGVETEAELKFFCQHSCDEVQGFLFSYPLSAADFENLLISGKSYQLPVS